MQRLFTPRNVVAGYKDEFGKITRSDDWKRERIQYLMARRHDNFNRIVNCEKMIATLSNELGFQPFKLTLPTHFVPPEEPLWDIIKFRVRRYLRRWF